MNIEMAYLLGMIIGNGELQQYSTQTKVTIDIPHKNLYTDDMKDTAIYVKASLFDIQSTLEPLIGQRLTQSDLGSLNKIFNNLNRTDLLEFGDGKTIKKMQIGKWDVTKNSIDYNTLIPKL